MGQRNISEPLTVDQTLEDIYASLANDNKDIDLHIVKLKAALQAAGKSHAEIDPRRLFQNNREGRKMMQAYFRKRGVKIVFKDQG